MVKIRISSILCIWSTFLKIKRKWRHFGEYLESTKTLENPWMINTYICLVKIAHLSKRNLRRLIKLLSKVAIMIWKVFCPLLSKLQNKKVLLLSLLHKSYSVLVLNFLNNEENKLAILRLTTHRILIILHWVWWHLGSEKFLLLIPCYLEIELKMACSL